MKFFKYSLIGILLVVGLFLSFDVVFTLGECPDGQILQMNVEGKEVCKDIPEEEFVGPVEPVGPVRSTFKKKTKTVVSDEDEVDLDFDFSMNLGANAVSQLCWTQEDCKDFGGAFYGPNPETIQTCGTGADLKKSIIGFCRPGIKAKTSVLNTTLK